MNAKKVHLVDTDQKIRIAKPTAAATIDPMGRRSTATRDYLIKIVLELSDAEVRYSDKTHVTATLRRSLGAYSPEGEALDRRQFRELSSSSRGKGGVLNTVVTGIEGSVVWPARPTDEAIEHLSATLLGEGYRLVLRERRECDQSACSTDAMVDWRMPEYVPMGWFSSSICGKHNYRRCAKCQSVYLLSCVNAAGQAPSVHCEVCGTVLVEWGTSKRWDAELVTRGTFAG